ncbi:16S rRNA (guanine(527)-N(7))-methyltransferase RsmG [Rhodospira trueperi]|uniref:Ribosomal RNA small subunit methyltransferase G n=1 Tax=Rhodospira trueperi TaxID=69960 RepID=A0A1G7CCK1_9PROT|nr:16S rRNA (guanine(527)-N(7))-methyltransferase RsmG [Rhodospira trueperi]SDE37057.1 16S rRNA (guanine527-N7)-methyltransferase [Rhodospira trueperi]
MPRPPSVTKPAGRPRRPAPTLALPPRAVRRDTLATALGQSPESIPDALIDRLTTLLERLDTWTRRINLVGGSTLPDAWARHVLDSAALMPLIPPGARRLADLGSGAGFPGLVLAILGAPDVHLVESDQRKAVFLREAARATAAPVTVHAARIEALASLDADVVTARALAPLPDLLPLVTRHLTDDGVALLPKGRDVASELTACANQWIMRVEHHPASAPVRDPGSAAASAPADPGGRVLILREIRRVPSDA